MKKILSTMVLTSALTSGLSYACPSGQHRECAIPRPWGGCAQWVCVPDIKDPIEEVKRIIQEKANQMAIDGKTSEKIKNREDCMILVTAGLTAWGAAQGGTVGALVGGSAGAAAASIACRNAFPL